MKKLTAIFAALSLFLLASSFALPPDSVSIEIKSAFQKIFLSASNVSWKKMNNYYLATFKINDQQATAAYDEEGQLMSASRSLTLSQLPLNINLALQNQFPEYTFGKSVTEITIDGQSNYYIKGENDKKIIIIKANGSGNLNVENKTKK
ncbi:MAG: hypothetical protein ABJA71_01335 [Ginsengibacter sp.]